MKTLEILKPEYLWPFIELITPQGAVDLHNFALLEGFRFSPTGQFVLDWKEFETGKFTVGQTPVSKVRLVFSQVRSLLIIHNGAGLNDALEDIGVVDRPETADCSYFFRFEGGMLIEVRAGHIVLEYDERE